MVLFDRRSGRSSRRQQQSKSNIFPAPRRGLVRNDAYASPRGEGAEVLDNFFPTTQGARLRGGLLRRANVGAEVTHLAVYNSGALDRLFATTANSIFNVTNLSDVNTPPTADVTGLTSGDFSSVQFTAGGGIFLVMVNGANDMRQFDGTAWKTINATSTPAFTGVDTSRLSQTWKFKNRLFFIERGTLSAWYLPVNSIAGAAAELPLGGVFQMGGSLLFGATWSLDSGSGLDDVCLFITTEGEVAVYQGTDPANAASWALVGVYQIGRPLGKNSWFKAGGDIAIATDDAIVPISVAVKADKAAITGQSITFPIEELWRDTVNDRKGSGQFNSMIWYTETMLVIGVPSGPGDDKFCLVLQY